MHIQEFYRKFISVGEQGNLFAALRKVSQIEDAKALLNGHAESALTDWGQWPVMAAQ
ncbi:MAG: hypothetical protein JF614_16835 [Acidobacteria bacterium]|jgi:hypothetical protein|nr:hypothetical protein [Acidobacteriota bacterium]